MALKSGANMQERLSLEPLYRNNLCENLAECCERLTVSSPHFHTLLFILHTHVRSMLC